jgi:hypothetical protein
MVLLNKLNDTDDNIAFNSMPDGSASSDEGTMKEPLVIESEIPMAIGSSGAHETTTSTQQMPTNVVGQPFLPFRHLVCTHLRFCFVLFVTLYVNLQMHKCM